MGEARGEKPERRGCAGIETAGTYLTTRNARMIMRTSDMRFPSRILLCSVLPISFSLKAFLHLTEIIESR